MELFIITNITTYIKLSIYECTDKKYIVMNIYIIYTKKTKQQLPQSSMYNNLTILE